MIDYTGRQLFANDVIIIGSVRADWPAHFNVTTSIGNPRADKLGLNGFECIGRLINLWSGCQRKVCPGSEKNFQRVPTRSLSSLVG